MDKSIKKSLFNKNIESFTYNPQIVVNKREKTIKQKLEYHLSKSNRFDIAVSYVVWSGLQLIIDRFNKYNKNSRMIITTEGFVTDPRSLKALYDLNISVKVYDHKINNDGFHFKSYLFEKGDKTTLLVGSNNISSRAFGYVHEMALEVEANNEGKLIYEYQKTFEDIWNNKASKELTAEYIEEYTKEYQYNLELEKRNFEIILDENKITPNYMQQQALIELEEAREEYDMGLVIAATGTGKTYLSAFDVLKFNANKMLFLVHNRLILNDAIKTFKRVFNKDKRIIELNSNNIDKVAENDFIFTTDKTAYSHLMNKVPPNHFDYIIYDEAHKIGKETQYDSLINYFKPKFTLGITATPERTDNPRHLFETFKFQVPYEIRLLDSMEQELVCPFTYYGLNLDEKLLKPNEEFDYVKLSIYLKELIKEKGHYGQKLKALIFAQNIKESNNISSELNKIGFISRSAVSGSTTQAEIEGYIDSLKSDEKDTIEIICTVNKFNEGIDIPDINVIIMLRNTTSAIIYLQQLGRGLRKTYDPHKFVTVFDIIGNSKNNYTIAEVLTGNETKDKRLLYKHVNTNFEMVSPFINVLMEEEAIHNVIKSISNNFKVRTQIQRKFKEELSRYEYIPSLKYLYKNPNFKELELMQLLYKDLYTPFQDYYNKKYNIPKNNLFLRNFFSLISQFVFRAFDNNTLKDYVAFLKTYKTNNSTIKKVLMPNLFDGYSTAVNSNYYKKTNGFVEPFVNDDDYILLNPELINELKKLNALELFNEHIELFEEVSKGKEYHMNTFDLVDKADFLFNVGAKDCYMNVVGERIDHEKKTVYCTIKITEKESNYDNYIIDQNKVIYYTQWSTTKEGAINKINKFKNEDYKFYVCAQFPHLGYSSTSYFNLGTIKASNYSEVKTDGNGRYNHEIEFTLEENILPELLEYKSLD